MVDEAQCDELLANVYAGYATAENGAVERPVQEGDTVNIDYEGKLDGAAFEQAGIIRHCLILTDLHCSH